MVDFYFGRKRVSFVGIDWLATQFHGPFAVFIVSIISLEVDIVICAVCTKCKCELF